MDDRYKEIIDNYEQIGGMLILEDGKVWHTDDDGIMKDYYTEYQSEGGILSLEDYIKKSSREALEFTGVNKNKIEELLNY